MWGRQVKDVYNSFCIIGVYSLVYIPPYKQYTILYMYCWILYFFNVNLIIICKFTGSCGCINNAVYRIQWVVLVNQMNTTEFRKTFDKIFLQTNICDIIVLYPK